MAELRHKRVGEGVDTTAPDGSEVRFLLRGERGELNHFTLPPGATSGAVAHRAIEEIWYFLSGAGEMWRSDGASEETLAVGPGVCVDIATGVGFQFRNTGPEPLTFLIATMPPWPGAEEAYAVEGKWPAGGGAR
ncbi:MAG: cupin domain-containing protein [Chloroflexi bacterium]|nr:cupin domain-containing protein [Chloroflexota bacterium]